MGGARRWACGGAVFALLCAAGCGESAMKATAITHATIRPLPTTEAGSQVEVRVDRVDERGNRLGSIVRPTQLTLGRSAPPLFVGTTTLRGASIIETIDATRDDLLDGVRH